MNSTANKSLGIVWVSSLILWIVGDQISTALDRIGRELPGLSLLTFMARLVVIFVSVYFVALAIRWLFRKVFWRVGSRLALSYFLIGVLPFIFFAILVAVSGYIIAGVLSQATFKMEESAWLAKLSQWNVEYALTEERPTSALPTLEIYDSSDGSTKNLPAWLQSRQFTGFVQRKSHILFVSAKIYDSGGDERSVVLLQPIDRNWSDALERKNGMIVATSPAKATHDGNINVESDGEFTPFFKKAWKRRNVIWGDISPPLYQWESGKADPSLRMATAISNPGINLLDFYFGNSQYVRIAAYTVGGIAAALAILYFFATLLAAALIFSITRAVNRIEKGTKAVEKGDFSYRIGMRPTNQLGEVAHSFNRMTESISSLLVKVAEKERLQSEIDIAASIQRNLLPQTGPNYDGVTFSAHFEPTAQIGGDYYDVFQLDRSRMAVAIGDVSGHGLSTGLVMAMVKAALSTLVEEGADEASLFHRLNDLVLRSTDKRAFMTLGFTIFDLEARTIRHTNAGHLYPYLIRGEGIVTSIEVPSLPLGVRSDAEARTAEVELQENDTVVYLSDGIIEAQDDTGEPFGFERLEAVLSKLNGKAAAEIQNAVLEAVARHCSGRPADDDRTVMVIRFDRTSLGELSQPESISLAAV